MEKDTVKFLSTHWKKQLVGEIIYIKLWRKRIKKTSGTKLGGQKARNTNIEKYGKDFYRRIGQIGGRNGHTGGFAANRELARIAGAKGGRISKRGKAKKVVVEDEKQERVD